MRKLALAFSIQVLLGLAFAAPPHRCAGERDYPVVEKEESRMTFRAGAAGAFEVVVDNVWGGIAVTGGPGDGIELVVRRTLMAESKEKLERAKAEVRLDVSEKPERLRLYVDGPFRCQGTDGRRGNRRDEDPGYIAKYDFELRVPTGARLDLSTVMAGDVSVQGVEGDFDIDNVNGAVRLAEASGSGEARTVNGDVRAAFRRLPARACAFATVNGELAVTFPEELSADLRIKSMNGDVFSDFFVTGLPSEDVRGRREGGRFIYEADKAVGVRVGRGGPEIALETLNGDILIHKANTTRRIP